MGAEKLPLGVFKTPAAFKFKLIDIFRVALGVCSALDGIVMLLIAALVFRTPFCTVQPCTI